MIVSTIVCSLSGFASANPLVAYSCRYYYPARSPKTSVHQVYVSDVYGGHRRQITFDKSEKTQVQWVGKHKLAWIESEGLSERETWYGYHMPTKRESDIPLPGKLVLYDLQTNRRKLIARGNFRGGSLNFFDTTCPRGVAAYFQYLVSAKGDTYQDRNIKLFLITAKSIKTTGKVTQVEYGRPTNPWSVLKLDKEPQGSSKEFVYRDREGQSTGGDYITQNITMHGKTVFVPVDVDEVWKSNDNWKAWFQIATRAGSAGSDEWIYEIDWKKGTSKVVVNEVLGIDFDSHARYWAAGSNNKSTTQLGKLMIWSGDLWCGDLRTGKQWRIAAGPVHGDCAAIQP